jgi:aspartokinase/homoserine dehydrogenase 1
MIVHKFGGSSLENAGCFKKVLNIITEKNPSQFIVVSATKGTTNKLIEFSQTSNKKIIKELKDFHLKIIQELNLKEHPFLNYFSSCEIEILGLLSSIEILKSSTPDSIIQLLSSYGELWSSFILTQLLNDNNIPANQVDARDFITVVDNDIDFITSLELFDHLIVSESKNIITGFRARTKENVPCTLNRNGSDYTASIIGNLINAKAVYIWTDISGVCSADPRIVNNAHLIKSLSYDEAIELAHFGATVIHPKTMNPVIQKKIPIIIKNTFEPNHEGTIIQNEPSLENSIKGFSVMENLSLFNIEGNSLIGLPGVASNIFSVLKDNNISIILITQGSSEYSISFVIKSSNADTAKNALNTYFEFDINKGKLKEVDYQSNISIIACVGDNMSSNSGIAGDIFSCLGKNKINIRAIAQGSSERNISIVINSSDVNKSLNYLHNKFFEEKRYNIFVIGVGGVGKKLCERIVKIENPLINLVGFCNSAKMIFNNKDTKSLFVAGEAVNIEKAIDFMKKQYSGEFIIADCTSNNEISMNYLNWVDKGMNIVTANKKGLSADIEYFSNIQKNINKIKYETTVGAGLPIIGTIKSLIQSGDKINKIEATLSGTLSYIFNTLNEEVLFSSIVKEAFNLGYTEPDPRDDLNGNDIAKKALILARECGLNIELKDIEIDSLYNKKLDELNIEDFMSSLKNLDKSIQDFQEAKHKLCYTVSINLKNKKVSLKLVKINKKSNFFSLQGTDNMVVIHTDSYDTNPLVIKGPGAGVEVTSLGLLSDIIQIIEENPLEK